MSRKKLTIITILSIAILICSYFVAANFGYFSGGTNAPSVPEDTMTRGLVGYWEFEEGTGQTAYDGSNNSNNGQLGSTASSDDNDPSWTGDGKNGGGMKFDGVDDYVDCGDALNETWDEFTFELWMRPNETDTWMAISEGGSTGIYGNSPSQLVWVVDGEAKIATGGIPTQNQWYHLVGTFDNGSVKFYRDTEEVLDTTISSTSVSFPASALLFGRYTISYDGYHFNGSIDSVRVYNRALDADEVRYHYNRGGPVGSWNFDEGSGLTAFDGTGNNNDGTLKSSGLEFDGVNDYVQMGSYTGIPDGNEDYAYELWFNVYAQKDHNALFSIGDNATAQIIYPTLVASGEVWIVHFGTGNDWGTGVVLNANEWYHFVLTWNGATEKLYINGIERATQDHSAYSVDLTDFEIGHCFYSPVGERHFNGSIDEVRIYNDDLSAAEIARHYNNDFSQDPTANLVFLQHFEEGMACQSGACLTDDSGNGNDGTPTNFNDIDTWDEGVDGWISEVKKESLRWTNGKYGTAGEFDGGGDNVYQAYDSDFDFGTGSFSVSSWFKHNTIATSSDYLLSRYDADQGFKIWMDNSGDMCFGIDDDATWDPDDSACTSGIDYDDNAWHHLSAYKDGATGIYLYIDGNLVSSDETLAATATLTSNSAPLRIGSDAPNPLDSWEGMIDNVMIYPYVREPGEIRLDYNAGVATHLGPSDKTCSVDPAGCVDYGLVGSWGMDEGTGTTAYDGSDNSNDGILTNGPKWTADSSPLAGGGGSLKLDGVDDYVGISYNNNLNVDAITIEAWIYPDGTQSKYACIAERSWSTAWFFQVQNDDKLRFFYKIGGTASHLSSAGTVTLNKWNHVIVTYDGVSNGKFYINNTEESWNPSPGGSLGTNAASLRIGGTGGGDYNFNGSIDSVRIYNRALSAEEVRYHYNKGGPVAEWKFDEGSGQTAFDESFNNNDGTLGATIGVEASDPTWVEGKYGGALSFDGGDDYVETTLNPSTELGQEIAVSCWIFLNAQDNYDGVWGWHTGGYHGFRFQYVNGWNAEFGNGASWVTGTDLGDLPLNTWIHIAAVFKGSNYINTYVDGAEYQQNVGSDISHVNLFKIGKAYDAANRSFNGTIDDVRIYNYARTADEIRLDYNAGVATHLGPSGKTCSEDPAGCMDYGLVGSWGMDEGTGTTAYDGSDNSNDGTLTNGPKWTADSSPLAGGGGSLKFDGVDDYVNVGSDSSLDLSLAGTVEVWIKSNGTHIGEAIAGRFNGNGYDRRQYAITYYNGKIELILANYNDGDHERTDSGITPTIGVWYHVTGTWDGETKKIYVNGDLKSSLTQSFTPDGWATNYGRIGSTRDDSYFNGSIDDVRIYNRALSADEVRYHYNKGGPVAEWKFDEGSGQTAFDGSFNNNDGTLTNFGTTDTGTAESGGDDTLTDSDKTWSTDQWADGTITTTGGTGSGQSRTVSSNTGTVITASSNWTTNPDATTTYSLVQAPAFASGKYGSAIKFDGVDDYVNCGSGSSLDFGTGDFSASLWIKGNVADNVIQRIIGKYPGSNSSWFLIRRNTGLFEFTTRDSAGVALTAAASFSFDNNWHHIAFKKYDDTVYLYIDGVEKVGNTDVLYDSPDNAVNLQIGQFNSADYFNGSIDDVRIYNYARTAEQIQMDYNAGVATHFR